VTGVEREVAEAAGEKVVAETGVEAEEIELEAVVEER
jgi:hypothetical protein